MTNLPSNRSLLVLNPLMNKEIPSSAKIVVDEWIQKISNSNRHFISGIYLTGSIALDDFHSDKSDIDFLVLCNDLPDKNLFEHLREVHRLIESKYKNPRLNGSYITLENLNVNSTDLKVLHYQEGKFKKTTFEMAAITLYELKTNAITIFGTPVEDLPLVIHLSEVHKFLFDNINSYWKEWVRRHSFATVNGVLLILFPRLTEWVILGLARQFYTLRTGSITSKTKAGQYCLENLPLEYHAIIRDAIKIRLDNNNRLFYIKSSYYPDPSLERAKKTLECAGYIIQTFNKEYKENNFRPISFL